MADLSVTAASVSAYSGATIEKAYLAGATITAGQAVYLDSNNVWQLADANASATTAACSGIALNGGASGQPIAVLTAGGINPGATVVVGTVYVLSATPGGIAPNADSTTGWYKSIIGIGITSSRIDVGRQNSGVAIP